MKLSNKQYDFLKWITILLLPASAVLYKTLAQEWGLPYEAQIPNTINAITVFLGAILGISCFNYGKDGDLNGEA